MQPTQAGAAPWPSSVAMGKLCGATSLPERLSAANAGSACGRAATPGRRVPVSARGAGGKALRRAQLGDAARGGEGRVVMQAVGVVHGADPGGDVVIGDGLADGGGIHRLAEVLLNIGGIESF